MHLLVILMCHSAGLASCSSSAVDPALSQKEWDHSDGDESSLDELKDSGEVEDTTFEEVSNNWLHNFQFAVEGVAQSTVGIVGIIGERKTLWGDQYL